MAPPKKMPVYSREVATIGDFVLEEELLRFKMRLEINKFPEGVFNFTNPNELKDDKDFQELLNTVLNKMITDFVIIAYAKKNGIEIPQEIINAKVNDKKKKLNPKGFESLLQEKNIPYSRWKQLAENEIRVQYVLDKELSEGLVVSPAEIRAYYHKYRDDFVVSERVRARQIVTDTLEKARDVHARLLNGENFAKIAVNHSLSPDRTQGGDLGFFAKGSLPKEFDETCFKLKKGEISPIVKSDYGYHIFKLLDRQAPGRKTLLEASPQIYQKLFEEKLKSKYDAWISKARADVEIKINHNSLDSFFL
ncbi:peptidylprolyl isomerase [bacterium]|nr:peptidylprolyl isomerase [bacterium]MBU1917534.1 peptidylprolyl isomerase [bacterium]